MRALNILLAGLALAGAGCIRIEQKLVLNHDASGTFEVSYSVPDETTQRIKAMLKLADELAEAGGEVPPPPTADDFTVLLFDPSENALRRRIQTYAGCGIHLDKLEVKALNARRDVKFTLSFDNVAALTNADFFANYGFSLSKTPDGQYVLFTRPVTQEKLDPAWSNDSQQEDYKMMAPLLGGFHFSLEVQVPGNVLRTSASDRESAVSVQWDYDFDANHMALDDLQRKSMTVVFSSTGLNLPLFQQPVPVEPVRVRATPGTNAPALAPPAAQGS